MLQELLVAFCLMLVIEGIMPFAAPGRWRLLLKMVDEADDNTVRFMGLASMLSGVGLLMLIN